MCAFLCIINFKLLQAPKGFTDQAKTFTGYFLHHYLQFLWKVINFELCNFYCSKTTFLTQKYKTLLILCFNNIFTISVWKCIKIAAILPVLSSFIQLYPLQKSVNFQKMWLLKIDTLPPCASNPHYRNNKIHIILVLSLIYPVIITEQVRKSQFLKCFTFLKIFGKTRILRFS